MLHNNTAFDFTRLPWNIESAMSAILFYCIGNLYVKYFKLNSIPDFINAHRTEALLGCTFALIVFVTGALFNGHVTLGSNELGKNTILLYVSGVLGSIIVIVMSAILANTFGNKNEIVNSLKYIGTHSFDYMAVHVPIKGILALTLARIIHSSPEIISKTAWQAAIVYILTMAGSTMAVMLISKLKTMLSLQKKW